MQPNDIEISDDDPELAPILRGLSQAAYRINQLYGAPWGASKTAEEVAAGRIRTFSSGGSRIILALDYAKYLLRLQREAALDDQALSRHEKARERGARSWQSRRGRKGAAADAA
jgi:hypothetical protein